jgi:hypothetical protein
MEIHYEEHCIVVLGWSGAILYVHYDGRELASAHHPKEPFEPEDQRPRLYTGWLLGGK